MPESQLFSEGVDRLLDAIRPYGRVGKICYPQSMMDVDSKFSPDETLHAWFERLVNNTCDGNPKRVAIEDNIAVFVTLRCEARDRLTYANIQTIIATKDLQDYFNNGGAEATYLRLDFDYTTLGEPFSHPLAHIHVEGKLGPRFSLDGGNAGNIVVDYLEFIYRHYVPSKWRSWAERVWSRNHKPTSEDEPDLFEFIMNAFASQQFNILRDNAFTIDKIKRTLRKVKDEVWKLHVDGTDRELLEYPTAR